nr:hypothetical protein Q903MT_gene327 [Picea sitchensis]
MRGGAIGFIYIIISGQLFLRLMSDWQRKREKVVTGNNNNKQDMWVRKCTNEFGKKRAGYSRQKLSAERPTIP